MPPFFKKIVCLADSRKSGGRCIAGKEILGDDSFGPWIRPVSSRDEEEISYTERQYENGSRPQLLDIIEIPFRRHSPNAFQTENYLINSGYWWEQQGCCEFEVLPKLCDNPSTLWNTDSSSYYGLRDRVPESSTTSVESSLYLISPQAIDILVRKEGEEFGNPRKKVRARVSYKGIDYILPVTDPKIEDRFLALDEGSVPINQPFRRIFMCISLGLTYTDGTCYKFIASIIGL